MKKPGDWIAAFGTSLKVRRISVEASPALDLIELRIGGETPRSGPPPIAPQILYFDRAEGARFRDELGAALDQLERSAIEAEAN